MAKKLIIGGLAVLVVAVGAFWWFVLREDAPPPATLDDLSTSESGVTDEVPENLDGTWEVISLDETYAGFRIKESFLSGIDDHTALGKVADVTGSLTVDGSEVTEGEISVDLTALEFTDDPPGLSVTSRANAMKGSGLETSKFPTATFTLTEPIDIGTPTPNEETEVTLTGDLTLHGVTKEVSIDAKAKLVGNTIQVEASGVPVVLADYDIEKPVRGPVAGMEDEGSFEFLLVFRQAS